MDQRGRQALLYTPAGLTHGLLAIALVLTASAATGRGSATTTSAILLIPLIHVAILVGSESLVRHNPQLVFVVAAAILIEFAAAMFLLRRQNANFPKIKANAPQLALAV